jgi:Tfp pilus assembly protein PilE
MRANRAEIYKNIIQRMRHDTATYPLAMAMSDVEEYYRAGTLTGGLVKAQATVSAAELLATQEKAAAMTFSASTRPSQIALEKALAPGGVVNKAVLQKLAAFLAKEAPGVMVSDLVENPSRGDLADRAAIAIGLTF